MHNPLVRPEQVSPMRRLRPPSPKIPPTRAERIALKRLANAYVAEVRPVPPLSFEELRRHATAFLQQNKLDARYADYSAVLLNSAVWRESLAAVPFKRRLLLLPKCLRVEDECPAPLDEFGLLCQQCGRCSIHDLQTEAERLGYAVLVAEGSAVVMSIIQTRQIDAIIGVSCLSVLEKAFPYMESAGIPGVAIPLLHCDCRDTAVDSDWVWDVIHLTSEDRIWRLDLDSLRGAVDACFEAEGLERIAGPAPTATERVARSWLAKAGKRWRPFLAACTYKALRVDATKELPADVQRAAVAVECFHKASLIHDDIEDNDAARYGEKTLHEEYGVPVALNAGDLLLGEGYRLIGECEASAEIRGRMLKVAAAGHRTLCLGQGAELAWARNPRPLSVAEVVEIFKQKTAPAFEVALRLGALCAVVDGATDDAKIEDILARYSEALGIAYQIRDDVDDLAGGDGSDLTAMRPALPLAVAYEQSTGADRNLLGRVWLRTASEADLERARDLMKAMDIEQQCRRLLESYKQAAMRCLAELDNASLKGLLRRVIGRIFNIEIEGWCSEFEAGHAGDGAAGATRAR